MKESAKSSTHEIRIKNRRCCNHVTVEPLMAFFCFVDIVMRYLYQNLFLQKYCHQNATAEPDLTIECNVQSEALSFVAFVNSWLLAPAWLFANVYTMLAISWSDQAGKRRRPLMFIPLIGMLVETGSAALQTHFWHWSVYYAVFSNIFGQLIFGGLTLTPTIFLYIVDITDNKNRSFRYGLVMFIIYLIKPFGYIASGFLLRNYGFLNSFLLCFALSIAALLSFCFVPDISEPVQQKSNFLTMIHPKRFFEAMKILFRKRDQHKRSIIIMMMVAFSIFTMTNEGL